MRLKDQVALVTGAGRGMGKAIALAYAREGAQVVVNDVDRANAEAAAAEAIRPIMCSPGPLPHLLPAPRLGEPGSRRD